MVCLSAQLCDDKMVLFWVDFLKSEVEANCALTSAIDLFLNSKAEAEFGPTIVSRQKEPRTRCLTTERGVC